MENIPSFKERYGMKSACVASGLYKGVGKILGMDIVESDAEVEEKVKLAKKTLETHDFVFLHIKNTDSLGEDGNYQGKKEFIERIDRAVKEFLDLRDTLLVFTADHSTPCALKSHSGDPVPVMMSGPGVRKDNTKKFGERECAKGGIGRIRGLDLIPEIMNITGRQPLYGD